jgi:hypothetical protein
MEPAEHFVGDEEVGLEGAILVVCRIWQTGTHKKHVMGFLMDYMFYITLGCMPIGFAIVESGLYNQCSQRGLCSSTLESSDPIGIFPRCSRPANCLSGHSPPH